MSIFFDMAEDTIDVLMDDFLIVGDIFRDCSVHLENTLHRCEECNLILKWEKGHFMVKERIVLWHKILKRVIEVDRAKIEAIKKLPSLIFLKGIQIRR